MLLEVKDIKAGDVFVSDCPVCGGTGIDPGYSGSSQRSPSCRRCDARKVIRHWTATEDAAIVGSFGVDAFVLVRIRWADGAEGERVWDDPEIEIDVRRDPVPDLI